MIALVGGKSWWRSICGEAATGWASSIVSGNREVGEMKIDI
jgi:hypothetical protein